MLYAFGVAAKIAGVLGVGGMIAAFIFAPAVATIIVQRAEALARAVLSTRAGCALVAGALAFGAGDLYRRLADAGRCDSAIAEMKAAAQTAAEQRDADIRAKITAQYSVVTEQLRKQADDLQQQVTEYEKQMVAAAAGGKCVLDAGALRLRNRTGKPAGGSRR